MLYSFLKYWVKLTTILFGIKINIPNRTLLNSNGPLLLIANHPNSFFDAIAIAVSFKQPIHILARGDAFNNCFIRYILSRMNMIPIYRLSEGRGKLHLNENSFDKANEILKNNGIVLIFIEGICINSHTLQPFKKGAARIALKALKNNICLTVLPMGIAYSSLNKFPFFVNLLTGKLHNDFSLYDKENEADFFKKFNDSCFNTLNTLIIVSKRVYTKNLLVTLHAILCFPLILLIKKISGAFTKNTVFYHSVLFALLLFLYPIYLLSLISILKFIY